MRKSFRFLSIAAAFVLMGAFAFGSSAEARPGPDGPGFSKATKRMKRSRARFRRANRFGRVKASRFRGRLGRARWAKGRFGKKGKCSGKHKRRGHFRKKGKRARFSALR